MKNRIPFAALTAAFTIAGGAVGHSLPSEAAFIVVTILAAVGGMAAAFSGVTE